MGDLMKLPERIEDFINEYSFRDDERTYTNGSMLIPVFRVKQAIEHYMPKWIPCSERLPEKPEFEKGYIVQSEIIKEPYSAYWDGQKWTDENDREISYVIAWMPLPDPYNQVEE